MGIYGVVLVAALVVVAGVLGAAEAALTHVGRAKALALRGNEGRQTRALARVLDDPAPGLNAILAVRLGCLVVVASVVAVEAAERLAPVGVVAAVVVEVLVLYLVAEAVPKTYALAHPEQVSLFTVPAVDLIARVPPVRWMARLLIAVSNALVPGQGRATGPVVSEQELLAMAGQAAESESIDDAEVELITSVIEFGDTVAREIMVPRPDMVTVVSTMTVGEALDLFITEGYSRIPVVGEGLDDIVGIAYAKDLIRAERRGGAGALVGTVVRPAVFMPETKPVAQLMRQMQGGKFHMALLVDEYGGIAGLVTLEDLIEELIGDIVDEFDQEDAEIERLPGGELRVSANLAVAELGDELAVELPDDDWDSVGGFVFGLLGRVPQVGEAVVYNGFRFAAEEVDGHRIATVRVTPLPADSDDDATSVASSA